MVYSLFAYWMLDVVYYFFCFFFFFKQKTAYEMRISDWSSDVCSSDLADGRCMSADAEAADAKALRRSIREQRRATPASQRISAAERLADRLLSLPFMPERGHVAGYWAVDGEIGLHAWQLRLPPSLTYCLPVRSDDHTSELQSLIRNSYAVLR